MRRFLPIFALAASFAWGGETPPPAEKLPPPSEDAIDVAKREFEAIKAARNGTNLPTGVDLPQIATPELQLGGSTAAAVRALPEKKGAKKKSVNWLVDGVMKQTEPTSARDKDLTLDALMGRDDAEEDQTLQGTATAGKNDKTAETAKAAPKPSDAELNPLTRFMAGWMTSQDYTLLRPGLNGDTAADTAARADPSLPVSGASAAGTADFSGKDPGRDLAGPGDQAAVAAMPRDNPFLQSFAPPAQPAAALPVAPGVPAGETSSFTAPPAPVPARPAVPDFAKPADDAKYFKQLKRF